MIKIQENISLLQDLISNGLVIHKGNILRLPLNMQLAHDIQAGCEVCGESYYIFAKDKGFYRLKKSCGKRDCYDKDLVTPVVKALMEHRKLVRQLIDLKWNNLQLIGNLWPFADLRELPPSASWLKKNPIITPNEQPLLNLRCIIYSIVMMFVGYAIGMYCVWLRIEK